MKFRFARLFFVISTLCLIAFLPNSAQAGETKAYDGNKNFDELTHAEKTAAKIAARSRKLKELRVCADPDNMPLSSAKGEGFQNKIIDAGARHGHQGDLFLVTQDRVDAWLKDGADLT